MKQDVPDHVQGMLIANKGFILSPKVMLFSFLIMNNSYLTPLVLLTSIFCALYISKNLIGHKTLSIICILLD